MREFKEMTLETDRLSLVRIKGETHGEELNRVVCDTFESLEPWVPWAFKIPTVEDTINGLRLTTDNHNNYIFNIYLRENDHELIGNAKCVTIDKENCYELGYWLHQKHCGKGFTTECVQRLIKFARDELKASAAVMIINENNKASLRIADKTGFQFVRKIPEDSYALRPEWKDRMNHYVQVLL